MAAMFSNSRPAASSSGHIVEFKAGRSRLEAGSGGEGTKKVIAEATKGLVYIKQSNDMLIHFCWKNRETGALVDDLIIFPDDAEFKAVTGCSDGKVFMLKFKSSGEMKLFWLQDQSPEVEKDLVKKVNDALNKPPTTRPSASRSSGSNANTDRPSAGGLGQDFNAMGGLDQGQLMSLIQSLQGNNSDSLPLPSSGSTSTAAATAGDGTSSEADCEPPVGGTERRRDDAYHEEVMQRAIRYLDSQMPPKRTDLKKVFISLADVLSNDEVAKVVNANAERLTPLLPPSDNPAQELSDTVKTPQFRQAADALGTALQTGQLGPVLSQFGMDQTTIAEAEKGSLLKFTRALTRAEGGTTPSTSSPESKITATPQNSSTQPDDDVAREPDAKRNRPDDMDDMDVD